MNINEIPDFTKIKPKYFDLYQKSKLLITDEIKTPPVCFSIRNSENEEQESILGTLGNFSMIIGKAKSRKTFFVSTLAAAALNNSEQLRVKASFPENRNKVVYVDTEQGHFHAHKVLRRIIKMCNLPETIQPDNFEYVVLRPYPPKVRLEIIDYIVNSDESIGLLIIDGIRDLVNSINDESESTNISTHLLEWSANKNIHIVVVLHQNKGDENARGHLGSELENKAESVINIRKSLEQSECSTIESKSMRDNNFNKYAFSINEENIPFETDLQSEGISKNKDKTKDLTKEQHQEIISMVFEGFEVAGLSYSKVWPRIKESAKSLGYEFGDNKCKTELFKNYCDKGWIKYHELNKIYFNGLAELPF